MMDIENTWKNSSGSDDVLHQVLNENINSLHSKLPLKKLKNNLLIGMVWAVLITAVYIMLYFFFKMWQVYIALTTLVVFNTWILIETWKLYKSIPETVSPGLSLKQELEKNYYGFRKWWHIQQRVSLFVYPIAITGGFILGGFLGSGKPVNSFLYNPKMRSILGITILILVPLCYYGARWMFNYAYGQHLKKLKQLIEELST